MLPPFCSHPGYAHPPTHTYTHTCPSLLSKYVYMQPLPFLPPNPSAMITEKKYINIYREETPAQCDRFVIMNQEKDWYLSMLVPKIVLC